MQRTYYFTDQDVLAEDLNNTENTKIAQMKKYAQYPLGDSGGIYGNDPTVSASIVRGGVYGSEINYAPGFIDEDSDLKIKKRSATELTMAAGAALDASGELIIAWVSGELRTMEFGSSGSNYTWVLPGGPYIEGAIYYVKLKYAEVTGSLKANDAGILYPTRYTNSFFVTINGVKQIFGEILLATFTGDSSGHIKSDIKDERLFIRSITPANAVMLDPTTRPVAGCQTVADHVNAVGSGTPTQTNPHGLTGNDIGLADTTGPHRKEAHMPGIISITGEYLWTTPFENSYLGVPYDEGNNAGIIWTAPHASASIMVNGAIYHPTLDTVDFTTHPDVVAGGYPNTYYFYYEGSGSVVRATTDEINPGVYGYRKYDKFALYKVTITDGGSVYRDPLDLRRFYSMGQDTIRADFDEVSSFPALSEISTLYDNLVRIRYQLGLALNGSDWAGDNPLTSGPSSEGGNYHSHSGTSGDTFTLNRVAHSVATYIGFEKSSGSPAYLGWNNSLSGIVAVDHRVGAVLFYARMVVGSLQIGSSSAITLTSTHVAAMPTLTAGPTSNADAYHTHDTQKQPNTAASSSYVFSTWRQNVGSSLITVIATGAYYPGQPDVYLRFYTGLTSGSAIKAGEFRMPDGFDAAGNIISLTGVVPSGWFYRFTALNLALTYNSGYGTGSLVEFYNTAEGESIENRPNDES